MSSLKTKFEASKNNGGRTRTSNSFSQNTANSSSFNNVIHKVKINLSKFDREDKREDTRWMNKIENYLAMHRIDDNDDKINITSMYLKKTTFDWFLWWNGKKQGGLVSDWDTFKKKFLKRFQDKEEDELYAQLGRLQKTDTVDGFFNELQVLAT